MSYLEILCNNTDNKRINLPKVDYPPDITNRVKMKVYRIAINMIKQTQIFKFIIPIVVFILLYAVSTIRNNNVRKDGIYSIVTLVKYGSAYRGQSAKYEFIYNKTLYEGSFYIICRE